MLKEFLIKGFVMDDERLKQGKKFGKDYFDELLERIREIRGSEAGFEAVSAGMELLLTHMQQHFASEEKLVQEAQYPSFRMHKAEHGKVLNEARYAEME